MKPNIFDYATSEYSQDAILCWLLQWANQKHQSTDPVLHLLGKHFLDSIYEHAHRKAPEAFQSIDIHKQDGFIDILCVVNGDTAIIIEDKVGTQQHSDQLPRYKEHVIQKGFPSDSILSVYLQTGDQSDYSEVVKHGYVAYERIDLLTILESTVGIDAQAKSDIVSDYALYLRRIEDKVQSYKTLALHDWSWESWKGFYSELQRVRQVGEWGYVPNKSGGFLGYWWHSQGDNLCERYLQLEHTKLCFKIYVSENDKRRELRDTWHKRVIEGCSRLGIKAKRPDRFGNGYCMTVAILDQEYRAVTEQNQIDLPATIELLKKAESVLNDMTAQQALGADLASSAAQA